jgi:hypothetical protein
VVGKHDLSPRAPFVQSSISRPSGILALRTIASANLDLVRSVCAAWERGDFSRAHEWAHPEIEFVIADGPSPGRWTGLDGLAVSWRDFLSAWQDVRQDTEEYRELDDQRVSDLRK